MFFSVISVYLKLFRITGSFSGETRRELPIRIGPIQEWCLFLSIIYNSFNSAVLTFV